MENKRVLFDGKKLSFDVDGVRVVNGKMPESFDINEEYAIDKDSLAKMVAVLDKNVTILEEEMTTSFLECTYPVQTRVSVYRANRFESKMLDLAEELYKENKNLSEVCQRILEENRKLHTKIDFLNSLIGRHNYSNFFSRMREIRKDGKV